MSSLVQGRYRLHPADEGDALPGTCELTGLEVVLELLPPGTQPRADLLAARLSHPGLVRTLEVGRIERGPPALAGRTFLAREAVTGAPLPEGADPAAMARAGAEALGALLALGGLGVAHGAVSPERLVTSPTGARLLGLGLVEAGALEPAASPWAAPELQSGGPLDPRGDLWSLGAVLYAAASGRKPDPHPLPLKELRPELPAGLLRAVQALLDPDPRTRGEAAAAAREQLLQAGGLDPGSPGPARLEPAWTDREDALRAAAEALDEARALASAGRAAREAAPARAQGAACLLLTGPPGIGRSRLLFEAGRRAALTGARALALRGWAGGDPYGPWRELLGRLPAEGPALLAREALAPGSALDPRTRHERVARALLSGPGAALLTVDDAHLLAEEGAELLLHLARAAAAPAVGSGGGLASGGGGLRPLGLVIAARSDQPGAPLLRGLARPLAPLHRAHSLSELRPAEATALLTSLRLAPEEVTRVQALAGGNPLALVQLAREGTPGGPSALQELIGTRLQRLSAPARALLEALSVLGRPAERAAAAGLGSQGAREELLAADLLRDAAGGIEPPALVRTAVLERLPAAALRTAAARALPALGPGASPGERARLLLQAGSPGAVEEALAVAEKDPAPEPLLAGAREAMSPGPARAAVGRRLGERLRSRGAYPEARSALESALGDLGQGAEPGALAALELELGELAWAEGEAREAQTWASRGRQRLSEAGNGGTDARPGRDETTNTLAGLLALEARVLAQRSDHAAAAKLLEKARGLVRARDPVLSARLALEESAAMVLALDRGRYEQALAQSEEAFKVLDAAGDASGAVEALKTLGNHAWYSGDPELAARRYQEALRRCEAEGLVAQESGLWNNLGLALRDLNELRRAEVALERSLDAAERLGQAAVTCRALTNLGRVRRGLGELAGACRSFRRAAEVARQGGEVVIESAALSELGRARLAQGRFQAALRALIRSRRLRLGLGDPGRVAESELELAELWRAAGDVRAAILATARALALRAALADPDGAALAVESLEFALGRPGGPAALLAAAGMKVSPRGPGPVRAALERGRRVPRLALRALAALQAARTGDLEQARAHLARAGRSSERLAASDLAPGLVELGRSLLLEAEGGLLAAEGDAEAARQRIERAITAAASPREVRAGALRLRLAFLELGAGRTREALRAALGEKDPLLVVPPLSERRAVARALVLAHARRAGAAEPGDAAVPAPTLPEAEETARRLGDVALLAAVASARAVEAQAAGDAREAGWQRAGARLAAERLARGLPESLQRALQRALAPAPEEAASKAAAASAAAEAELLLPLLTRVLQAGPDADQVLQAALEAAREAAGAKRGVLALVEDGDVQCRVLRGVDPGEVQEERPLRQLLESLARGGRPLLVPDTGRERRYGRLPGGSCLAVPARGEGSSKPVALVYLDHPERGKLGMEQRGLVQALLDRVAPALEGAVHQAAAAGELRRTAEAYRETARELSRDEQELIGQSPGLRLVQRLVERYGRTPAPVTIHGESGTGKELVARALHRASPRKDGPFVGLNCAAVAESLLESELFGAMKGAYTGADKDRPGLFELAHQGTLLLDEVGDMSLEMQAKLLRVLETGELRPVGGRKVIKVDVRIVSASHRDLRQMVVEGGFREDLFYRLNVLRIELPPLRERREDLPLLAAHILAAQAREKQEPRKELAPAALELLLRHPFPGNVRELKNALERACVLEPGRVIGPERLLLETPATPVAQPVVASPAQQAAAPAYQKTFEWKGVPLNRRQRQLLEHLQRGVAAITNREYCALLQISERTGLRDLTELVDQGVLTRLGKRKGARYRLAPPPSS